MYEDITLEELQILDNAMLLFESRCKFTFHSIHRKLEQKMEEKEQENE